MLYLVTSIFLMVDQCFPGTIREKLIVTYCRFKCNFDLLDGETDMWRLGCRTIYTPKSRQIPQGYPEDYLSQFPISSDAIKFALSKLISNDIYEFSKHYPDPSHRTTALSLQSGYVYVLLYHIPSTLINETSVMKAITEKFYADNWIVSWAPGFNSDLSQDWDKYKIARSALKYTMMSKVKKLVSLHWDRVPSLTSKMNRFKLLILNNLNHLNIRLIKQGKIQADVLLKGGGSEIFSLLREANFALRWILLNNYAPTKKFSRDTAHQESIVKFLLALSHMEYITHGQYEQLLNSKQERREKVCQSVISDLKSLAEIPLTSPESTTTIMTKEKVEGEESNSYWLQCLQWEVSALSKLPEGEASTKVKSLQRTFEEMGNFCKLESAATPMTRKLLQEIKSKLIKIHQLVNTRQELLDTLHISGEFSYAFKLVQNPEFYECIYEQTRQDTSNVFKMGCLLNKMRGILELPLYRGKKRNRKLQDCIKRYYEAEINAFGITLFNRIPVWVCENLDEIATIHTKIIKLRRKSSTSRESTTNITINNTNAANKTPTKAESAIEIKSRPRNELYDILANKAAIITEFAHEMTLVDAKMKDIVNLNSRRRLEDYIREHIYKRLAALADHKLHFEYGTIAFLFKDLYYFKSKSLFNGQNNTNGMSGITEFKEKLMGLKDMLFGYLRALECLHNSINITGYALWEQEVCKIITVCFKKECDWMINGKKSKFVLKRQGSLDLDAPLTFLGRLAREIIRLTSPMATHFSVWSCCWLDQVGTEAFDMSTVSLIRSSIGSQGLAALDAVFASRVFLLTRKLES